MYFFLNLRGKNFLGGEEVETKASYEQLCFLQNSLTKSVWALTAGRHDEKVIGKSSSLIKTSLFTTQFVEEIKK